MLVHLYNTKKLSRDEIETENKLLFFYYLHFIQSYNKPHHSGVCVTVTSNVVEQGDVTA